MFALTLSMEPLLGDRVCPMPLYIPPAGVSPIGTVLTAYRPLPPPPVIRADKLRYQRQSFESVFRDRDPVDAAVVEALWRVRGSGAAVANTGARFLDIEKLDDRAKTVIQSETYTALRRLIRRGDITIKNVVVETGPDWAEVQVYYLNNRAPFNRDRVVRKRLPEEIED